jgi:hypothetical protein
LIKKNIKRTQRGNQEGVERGVRKKLTIRPPNAVEDGVRRE